jgi:hypothetical protein
VLEQRLMTFFMLLTCSMTEVPSRKKGAAISDAVMLDKRLVTLGLRRATNSFRLGLTCDSAVEQSRSGWQPGTMIARSRQSHCPWNLLQFSQYSLMNAISAFSSAYLVRTDGQSEQRGSKKRGREGQAGGLTRPIRRVGPPRKFRHLKSPDEPAMLKMLSSEVVR